MSCREVLDLIPLFPADLEAVEAETVRGHVQGCAGCAAELGVYMAQAARFVTAREARSERIDLWGGIQAKLAEPQAVSNIIVFRPGRAAAAAAIVLGLGLLAWSRTNKAPEAPAPMVALPDKTTKPENESVQKPATLPEKTPTRVRPRTFFGEGAIPVLGGGRAKPRFGFDRNGPGRRPDLDVELVPLDEEAEIPGSKRRRFVQPDAVPEKPGTRSSDSDERSF